MDSFAYRDGELYCEQLPVRRIAETVGTPTYVYSTETFRNHYRAIARSFAELNPTVCYSIKSCQNLHILRLLVGLGAGMDVVSGGELFRALKAGADPARISYAGVGKTDPEIRQALAAGIGLFNIESEAELANLIELARQTGRNTRAALRVNPDVDPKTHRHTATGKRESKFGVDLERARRVFEQYGRNSHVRLCGIHLHIGSPVNTVEPYVQAVTKAVQLIEDLRSARFEVDTLDLGGGFGANYTEGQSAELAQYAEKLVPLIRGRGLKTVIEPGRSISANAGILLVRTTFVKPGPDKQFVIVDGSMTELIRPALYDAFHFAWPAQPGSAFVPPVRQADLNLPGSVEVDIVGPVCESADFLAKARYLPPIKRGDLIAVFTAGAYGFVMASHYNSRPNAAEVLVDGDSFRTIRRRETYDDLIAAEENA
ncbi:MAG: diaminopimelate decarboxylase [Phycisphaerae bacterium]|nr:diaminopimelate decarboxylase [Phycisphaerae bacterium]